MSYFIQNLSPSVYVIQTKIYFRTCALIINSLVICDLFYFALSFIRLLQIALPTFTTNSISISS